MGLLDGFEKLINEHGSATILKERISLANDKYSLLENKNEILKEQNSVFEQKIKMLESENNALKLKMQQTEQYVCDHCASPSLKRTGSRPDPTFGDLGVKQKLFTCNKCGKESAFTPENKDI
ncbi:cell division protein ZapB [Desulfobacula sp.]|uniref:cell division protein ZapB n=1 Tax=Desulfobacula sp. TaxID=2593537 RepID=UPI0026218016|nr:cell division protein ZapB [Desulfobacula sp.]